MKTIFFEMTDQDFSQWDIDIDGFVTECRPCQNWVWRGTQVVAPDKPKKGDLLSVILKNSKIRVLLRHRVSDVRYTCEVCRQVGFSESGLKAHQGTKACARRAGRSAL